MADTTMADTMSEGGELRPAAPDERYQREKAASAEARHAAGQVDEVGEADSTLDPSWTSTSMPDGNAPDITDTGSGPTSSLDRAAEPAPMPDSMHQPRKGSDEPGSSDLGDQSKG